MIRKTEEQGDQYDLVRYGEQHVLYPRPFLFSVQPSKNHLNAASHRRWARTLCLYDNAGESFSVGKDTPASPVTHHLARSDVLIYLFDPTQDPRFRDRMQGVRGNFTRAVGRQDTFLIEAINRIRTLTNLSQTARSQRPLLVVVTKYDLWKHLLPPLFANDPWRAKGKHTGLDVNLIEKRSDELRDLLKTLTPELVGAAGTISDKVSYLPVSALGCSPNPDPRSGKAVVRPADIRPVGVVTPLLYGLYVCAGGLVQFIGKPLARK